MKKKLKNNSQRPRAYKDNRSHWHCHTITAYIPEVRINSALIRYENYLKSHVYMDDNYNFWDNFGMRSTKD